MRHYKKSILIVLALCAMPISGTTPKKHVIGVRWSGLFSNFLLILNHIDWCLKKNMVPVVYWDDKSFYYSPQGYNGSSDNVWEYYFEPVSSLSYEKGDKIDTSHYSLRGGLSLKAYYTVQDQPTKELRRDVHERIIKPFIKVNRFVREKIDDFFDKNMRGKHTIGIHLRGTDKHAEVTPTPPIILLQTAEKYALPDSQFFIATDDQTLLDLAKETLGGTVIYYDSYRSSDGNPLHRTYENKQITSTGTSAAQRGEEVVIEALLLAQCNVMIHTCSNVSAAVLFLNPELENILFSPK